MKKPKKQKKTAEEMAMERRQTMMLNEEIEDQEDRFRKLARGSLGKKSLLSKSPSSRKESAGGAAKSAPKPAATYRGMGGGSFR